MSLDSRRAALAHRKDWMRRVAQATVPFALLLGLAVILQILSGTYHAELSSPDEPAHYVTGLMIRQYVVSGMTNSPLAFATDYYIHYPKVTFGIWPPFFHIVEATWMLVLPTSRISLLFLMALITGATAFLLYRFGRQDFSRVTAFILAAILLMLPTTQYVTSRVLADGLVTCLDLAAATAWVAYLDRNRWRYAVVFGVLGSLSMLTKGNGGALLLLPFASAAIAWRPWLLRKTSFWVGPLLMVTVSGPWQLYSWRIVQTTVSSASLYAHRWTDQFVRYTVLLRNEVGLLACLVATVGFATVCRRRHSQGELPGTWSVLAALPLIIVGFHATVPLVPATRYLMAATAAILWLTALGVKSVAAAAPTPTTVPSLPFGTVAVIVLGSFLATTFQIPQKGHFGIDEVATDLLAAPHDNPSVILVSSWNDASNLSGMLIAEMAMRENRPSFIVLRADKVLSRSNWDGGRYELLFRTSDAINHYLKGVPVDVIVLESSICDGEERPDHRLLVQALTNNKDWKATAAYGSRRQGSHSVQILRSTRSVVAGHRNVSIDMRYSLGRDISLK